VQAAPIEVEVKFLVQRLADIRRRLEALGAVVHSERVLEHNLRFDSPDRRLEREHQALRLRQDSGVTLTFKGPSSFQDGIRVRTEIEIGTEDFAGARQLLEALGYVVTFEYEKFRTTYALGNAGIMLDELPYGDFVEIEGASDAIKNVARQLGLRWETAVQDSYLGLFEQLKTRHNAPIEALTFDVFSGRALHARDLGLNPADA